MTKKTNVFIAFLLLVTSFNAYTMDQPEPKKKKPSKTQRVRAWATIAGNILR